jgi:hypothetical protein
MSQPNNHKSTLPPPAQSRRQYQYIDIVTSAFVAVLLISNVAATKTVALGDLAFDGGTILFPLSYIFGDILTEVYGYARSRRVIWIGFACAAVAALVFAIVGALPAASFWGNQAAYDAILGQTPRIVVASLLAYFAGEFSNSFVLARLKVRTAGRWLWLRTVGSTLIGQAIDTAAFVVIAFAGTMSGTDLWLILVSNYVFKVGVEVLFTPATYWIVNALKRAEGEDFYDRETNFNPFLLRS